MWWGYTWDVESTRLISELDVRLRGRRESRKTPRVLARETRWRVIILKRIMAPQVCLRSNPWHLWKCYFTWQKRTLQMQWSSGSRDGEIFLDYPCGPSVVLRSLEERAGRVELESNLEMLLALEMEEGARSQGVQGECKATASRRNTALPTPRF